MPAFSGREPAALAELARKLGEQAFPAGAVVLHEGGQTSALELRRYAATRVTGQNVPSQILLVDRKYTPEKEIADVVESLARWLPELRHEIDRRNRKRKKTRR